MIIKCQVSVSSLLLNFFSRVLKAMAQPTRSSQRTSAEERGTREMLITQTRIKNKQRIQGFPVMQIFTLDAF